MPRSLLLVLGPIAFAVLSACASYRASRAPRTVPSDTAPPASWYLAGGTIPEPERIEPVFLDAHHEVRRVFLPPRLPPGLENHSHARDLIEIVLYRPRPRGGPPRPLVLMSPILGNDMTLMPEFARGFLRIGYQAAVVMRKDFDFQADTALEDAEQEFRILVMRQMQALDWLCSLDEVDGSRVATFGVSAGAIISACVAGADERPRAHVLVLGGGPTIDVLMDTDEGDFKEYGEQLAELTGSRVEDVREQLRDLVRTDPVRLAPRVPRTEVLMFVARNDTSVPTKHGITLWEAYGRPAIRWLPWGHYASFLLLPWIQHEANVFLRGRLGPP